ncbi:hypothetical protein [Stenotrophomonas phage vB_SmaS_BUCT548]|uniref:Uncharacterized protein n=1 Tax=Stenotrophomonas phage vB_SmaS_BUCT548 TaxID=2712941 RepID=A0A7D2LFU6_9CAUD|nr:hypothetical protein PQD75_gp075 [Stenotrophomonas phage vB_SmaS_BUCT548]QIQ60797.1 hypothetical protein [Stenotrophomonas phage vB_SmaS_BUCT548]
MTTKILHAGDLEMGKRYRMVTASSGSTPVTETYCKIVTFDGAPAAEDEETGDFHPLTEIDYECRFVEA